MKKLNIEHNRGIDVPKLLLKGLFYCVFTKLKTIILKFAQLKIVLVTLQFGDLKKNC